MGSDTYDAVQISTGNYANMALADLLAPGGSLAYSTYVERSSSPLHAPCLYLLVDTDGDGIVNDELIFDPASQDGAQAGDPVPNQGRVDLHVWQMWDTRIGGWRIRNHATTLLTLAHYINDHPSARLANQSNSLRFLSGLTPGWERFIGELDDVQINGTEYDFEADTRTGVTENEAGAVGLYPEGPNPFQHEGRLSLSMSAALPVHVDVFNIAGRRVRSLKHQVLGPGRHLLVWDGRSDDEQQQAPGMYFVRAWTPQFSATCKLVLAR